MAWYINITLSLLKLSGITATPNDQNNKCRRVKLWLVNSACQVTEVWSEAKCEIEFGAQILILKSSVSKDYSSHLTPPSLPPTSWGSSRYSETHCHHCSTHNIFCRRHLNNGDTKWMREQKRHYLLIVLIRCLLCCHLSPSERGGWILNKFVVHFSTPIGQSLFFG